MYHTIRSPPIISRQWFTHAMKQQIGNSSIVIQHEQVQFDILVYYFDYWISLCNKCVLWLNVKVFQNKFFVILLTILFDLRSSFIRDISRASQCVLCGVIRVYLVQLQQRRTQREQWQCGHWCNTAPCPQCHTGPSCEQHSFNWTSLLELLWQTDNISHICQIISFSDSIFYMIQYSW